jgi:hypothetical protein
MVTIAFPPALVQGCEQQLKVSGASSHPPGQSVSELQTDLLLAVHVSAPGNAGVVVGRAGGVGVLMTGGAGFAPVSFLSFAHPAVMMAPMRISARNPRTRVWCLI